MTTREKEEQRKKQTPIIDGDARPDSPELEPNEKKVTSIKDDNKTTKNRVDTNSLEDFRDAKQE